MGRDQDFFLYGLLACFFYSFFRTIVSIVNLPSEGDWEAIHEFIFTGKTLLCLSDFVRKTQFRKSELRVAKATVDEHRV